MTRIQRHQTPQTGSQTLSSTKKPKPPHHGELWPGLARVCCFPLTSVVPLPCLFPSLIPASSLTGIVKTDLWPKTGKRSATVTRSPYELHSRLCSPHGRCEDIPTKVKGRVYGDKVQELSRFERHRCAHQAQAPFLRPCRAPPPQAAPASAAAPSCRCTQRAPSRGPRRWSAARGAPGSSSRRWAT